jgi:hypothetical protein
MPHLRAVLSRCAIMQLGTIDVDVLHERNHNVRQIVICMRSLRFQPEDNGFRAL